MAASGIKFKPLERTDISSGVRGKLSGIHLTNLQSLVDEGVVCGVDEEGSEEEEEEG